MQIKAKKGYNVILNDIDISLLAEQDYLDVSDELLNSSSDFKKLSHLIEIKGKKNVKKNNDSTKTKEATKKDSSKDVIKDVTQETTKEIKD